MGYSFRLAARVLLYVQFYIPRGLCYTSRGALAGTRNSSMGPPWRINLTTNRTMSERSYHRATSLSRLQYKDNVISYPNPPPPLPAVLVPVTGVRYNSLFWMCTLNTLTWPDLTWLDLTSFQVVSRSLTIGWHNVHVHVREVHWKCREHVLFYQLYCV